MGTPLQRGDVVFYVPFAGCDRGQWERGIVKRMCDDGLHAFVLYDTKARVYAEADLDNYTAARTHLGDLRDGQYQPIPVYPERQ